MGVAFAVSAMANGFVEYSEFADMRNARKVKCGGFRVTDMNDKVMLVRLTGLKPSTKYFYRIGADRIFYGGGYEFLHRLYLALSLKALCLEHIFISGIVEYRLYQR